MKSFISHTLLCMAALALPLALSTNAHAADNASGNATDKFSQMDTNTDAKVSPEEFKAAYPKMQQAAFDGIDTNKDKFISREEWDGFMTQHGMGRAGSGGMGGGMGGMPPKGDAPAGDGPRMITPPAK